MSTYGTRTRADQPHGTETDGFAVAYSSIPRTWNYVKTVPANKGVPDPTVWMIKASRKENFDHDGEIKKDVDPSLVHKVICQWVTKVPGGYSMNKKETKNADYVFIIDPQIDKDTKLLLPSCIQVKRLGDLFRKLEETWFERTPAQDRKLEVDRRARDESALAKQERDLKRKRDDCDSDS